MVDMVLNVEMEPEMFSYDGLKARDIGDSHNKEPALSQHLGTFINGFFRSGHMFENVVHRDDIKAFRRKSPIPTVPCNDMDVIDFVYGFCGVLVIFRPCHFPTVFSHFIEEDPTAASDIQNATFFYIFLDPLSSQTSRESDHGFHNADETFPTVGPIRPRRIQRRYLGR